MPPRLAAISGKLKGAIFAINEETLLIGRETTANLCMADASVSRRHCKIEKTTRVSSLQISIVSTARSLTTFRSEHVSSITAIAFASAIRNFYFLHTKVRPLQNRATCGSMKRA